MRRCAATPVIFALVLAACGIAPPTERPVASPASSPASSSPSAATRSGPPSATPTVAPSDDPAAERLRIWRDGLAALVPGLERLHDDPWHSTDKATVEAAVAGLSDAVPTTDDDHLLAGLLRTVALISATGRDAHTGLYPWGEGSYGLTSLPLRLWVFDDGVYVVDALPPYDALVGARIAAIGSHDTDGVIAALDPLVPRDNDETVTLLLPRFLLIPEILHGAGLVDDPGSVKLTLVDPAGTPRAVDVQPIPMADYNAWAGPYGLHLPDDPRARYLARAGEPLWFEELTPGVVYVQYNRVDGVTATSLADLTRTISRTDITHLIVDIRHNYGGEVSALEPVLRTLAGAPDDATHSLLIGRNTFSAGSLFAARYTADTDVTVVGEPMGGSPNAWGNPRPLHLGSTGLTVDVSTEWEIGASPDDERLTIEPDLPVAPTIDDVLAGRDPVLEAAIAAAQVVGP